MNDPLLSGARLARFAVGLLLAFGALLASPPAQAQTPADAYWTITTVAGTGEFGFGGDGGSAPAARLASPSGVALDGAGNLYIADTANHRIRKVDSAGVITTVAGTGESGVGGGGFSGDGGPAIAARLDSPEGVAVDGAGNLYISDRENDRIRKVDSTGTITTVAGTGGFGSGVDGDGGPASEAQLYGPDGVAVDGAGNLYIADRWNHRIRKVDSTGTITTVAGTGEYGFSGDGGPATAARLLYPEGVAVDGAGNLYIAGNHRIRKVDSTGTITTVAGTGRSGFGGDGGPAVQAQLHQPEGVAVDGAGNLYIADLINHRIRRVDSTGTITTIAGTGLIGVFGGGFSGDGGPASEARLRVPSGVAVDGAGNLYIADTFNHRIRKLTPMTGPVTPVPMIPGGSEWFSISATTPYSLTVEWREPENTGSAITDYDVRYREVGSGGDFIDAQHEGTARTATLTGLRPGTAYEVQVRATNAAGTGAWSQLGVVRTSPQQTGDQIYYFPHLAVGAGWQTTITYINYSPQEVSCQTDFLSDQGSPLLVSFADVGMMTSRIDVLPPGGSVHQETNVELSAPLSPGWARANCTGPVQASLLFRLHNSAGMAVAEAAVNAAAVAATRFVTFAEQGEGQFGTGVAYANPSATAAHITFTARAAAGRVLARVSRTLLPNGHDAQNMAPLFGLSSFTGSLEITSTEPIVTLSLNFEADPVFSSFPPGEVDAAAQGTTTYYFPHLAVGAGWQTTITYINHSPQVVSCQTDFLSDQGSPLMVSFAGRGTVVSRTDILPPGGSVHQETNVELNAPLSPGWARASCTGPVQASLLFRQHNSAGAPTGEAGVNAAAVAATRFVTFAEQGEGKFGTGVAYANPSARAALVTFTARDTAGQMLASADWTLLPGGHSAQSMASLFGLNSFTGSLDITSTAPIVSLSLNFEADPVFSSLPPGELDAADIPGEMPAPDLVVQIPFAPVSDSAPAAGANFILSVTVRNVGDAEASATTLRYYRSNDPTISSSDTPVGTAAVSALAASGASAESIRLTAPAIAEIYYYGACADAVSGESQSGNNCSQGVRVTVRGGSSGAGKMYWTDWWTAKIQRANLDGSGVEDLVTSGLDDPYGLALDLGAGKIYWTDDGTRKIQRANLDGSGVEDLLTSTSGLSVPHSLALDLGAGKMYWTDRGTGKIQRANLDGSGVEDLLTSPSGLNGPYGLALDPGAGKMYWTDYGTRKIQRANLDGSGVEDLVTSGLDVPEGLALDPGAGKMYWTDWGTDKIQRANLDGSGVEDLVTRTSGLRNPRGLALDLGAGKMYWTDDGTDKIQRANLDGSGVEDLVTSGLRAPYGLALDTSGGGGSSPPDLVVETPSVSVSTLSPGQSFDFRATVRNQGGLRSVATTLRYYRSINSIISTGDTLEGTDAVSALAASGASAESIRLTAPASAGIYYYGACADPVSGESQSGNNCSSPGVRVTVSVGSSGAGKMYWTDVTRDKIQRANLDGSGVEDLVTSGLSAPYGLALDLGAGKMYWTDLNTNKIQRANLDGSGVEDLVTSGLSGPIGLALDLGAGKMYWTDLGTDKIQRANLDGSGVEDLVTSGLSLPYGLALDLGAGKMYWTDWGTDKIQRANLDGSGVEDLVTSGLSLPYGLALDPGAGKMYWTDSGTDKIQRANLDGSGVEDLLTSTSGLSGPRDLALDLGAGKMYWTDDGTDKIQRANLDGSGVEDLVTSGLSAPYGLALDTSGGGGSSPPDLVVETPSVSVSTLRTGQSFDFRATVRNQGGLRSVATTLRYYRSINSIISTGDTLEGTDAVSALAASGASAESIRLTAPASAGIYYYGACADPVSGESQSGNNCSSPGVRVTVSVGSSGAGKMYWTDVTRDKIQRANLDGSGVEDLVTSGLSAPYGLALDLGAGKMYWTDLNTNKIQRANLDGSGVEDLVTSGLSGPIGLALDLGAGKMYWTDLGTDKIQRANLDGSGVEDLVTSGLSLPYGLALDLGAGKMYWTDWGTDKIQRANLDGSGVEDLVTSGLSLPYGLALDPGAGKMYWTDSGTDKIQRANLDGSGVEDLVTSGLATPRDLALDLGAGKMYWTDDGTDKIQRANLDGSGVEDLVTSGLSAPYGLALDTSGGGGSSPPDLVVETPSVSVSTLRTGQSFDFRATVRNQGGLRSVATTLRYYRSINSIISTGDTLEGTDAVSALAASGASAESIRLTAPASAGIYYYGACADPVSGESQSGNNCSSPGVRVTVSVGSSGAGKMYWTDVTRDKIQRANLDGSGVEDLVTSGLSAPYGLALDLGAGKMYWTDLNTDKIQRANLDGSGVEDLVTSGLSGPIGLALDLGAGKMYWTDLGTDKIQRANLDGSGVEDLVTSGLSLPYGLALDLGAGKMYWTDWGTDKIQRANLDGSGVEDLVTSGLSLPYGLALDPGAGKMYWTDSGTDKIQRANLDGSGVEDLLTSTSGLSGPRDLALDLGAGKMYWADSGTDKIQRANLDGSGVEDLVTSGLSAPYGLALDTSGAQ